VARPFPWKCRTCGEKKVRPTVTDYTAEMEHDGRSYTIRVPNLELLECESCKTRMLTDEARRSLSYALRKEAGLLLPGEIREHRLTLGLNQDQLAKYLKVAKETVSRWETGGQIQQRAMDLLLRIFFGVPFVRYWLDNPHLSYVGNTGSLIMVSGVGPITACVLGVTGSVIDARGVLIDYGTTESGSGRFYQTGMRPEYLMSPSQNTSILSMPPAIEARMKNSPLSK
jgi:putative zinc finger/helix-turn-helix YgiT family protein